MAGAILAGVKPWENRPRRTVPRGWPLPAWVALHAAGAFWCSEAKAERDLRPIWPHMPPREEQPRGALLGMMRIDYVLPFGGVENPEREPWALPGGWCLRIGAVRRLAEPIPCGGALGFWSVTAGRYAVPAAVQPLVELLTYAEALSMPT